MIDKVSPLALLRHPGTARPIRLPSDPARNINGCEVAGTFDRALKRMAPLLDATAYELVSKTDTSAVYQGKLDSEWLIGTVANGGYSLAVVNVCCQDFLANQLKSTHKDPFHIASTYLNATDAREKWTVEIEVTKRGKGFTNLNANLVQNSSKTGRPAVRLQVSLIFTEFTKLQSDQSTEPITIKAGSKYHIPPFNKSEPKDCTRNLYEGSSKMHYWRRLGVYRDDKAEKAFREQGNLSCASYMEFLMDKVPQEHVAHFNNAAITFLPDTTHSDVGLVAVENRISVSDVWLPTLFLSIEIKRALPSFPLLKVNSLTTIRHVDHGRFEQDVEIWSHPDDAERLGLPSGVKSVILCISRQVALTIPLTVQATIVNGKRAKL